jgi:hypothetical protein
MALNTEERERFPAQEKREAILLQREDCVFDLRQCRFCCDYKDLSSKFFFLGHNKIVKEVSEFVLVRRS